MHRIVGVAAVVAVVVFVTVEIAVDVYVAATDMGMTITRTRGPCRNLFVSAVLA
jgi:hypothetical protein